MSILKPNFSFRQISNIFRWRGAGPSRNGNGFAQQNLGSIRVRNCGGGAFLAQTTARVG